MKLRYTTVIILFLCSQMSAQKFYKTEKFNISFTSYEDLEYYENEAYPNQIAYISDNYEILILETTLEGDLEDLKNSATLVAISMRFRDIVSVGELPEVDNSYYVTSNNYNGIPEIRSYVISLYLPYDDLLYNIIITGADLTATEGERLVKSFRYRE